MAEIVQKREELKDYSPMMGQYLAVKEQYPDYILMYRLGDFYECFFEDALIASREADLTLTARDCGNGRRAVMCGVPFHKADVYVGKLVEHGYKVAICEQMEDPKTAVGIVKREVIRVVTPGTITDASLLNATQNNFLASLCYGKSGVGIGLADISTGEIFATFVESGRDTLTAVENELAAHQPAEVLINISASECREVADFLVNKFHAMLTDGATRLFSYEKSRDMVRRVYGDEADRLNTPELIMCVGSLLLYIQETQKTDPSFVRQLNVYTRGEFLELDINTRRNLELVEAMRTKEKRGSLLWVLDKTKTAMGARLLRSWILKPLLNPVTISQRQASVGDLIADANAYEMLGEALSSVLDIERLTAKAVYGTANARDLRALALSIEHLPEVKTAIGGCKSGAIREISDTLDPLEDICRLLMDAIAEDAPLTVRDGGMIRAGFNADVDYYRSVKNDGSSIMRSIEERERQETGIKGLKVDYNKVFGYYIEIPKSAVSQAPDRYVRKQTLTTCERYITQELKEMENTIFGADEKLVALEYDLFCKVRGAVAESCERIRHSAAQIAELDVYRSFAELAMKQSYVCPEVTLTTETVIRDGRHPVVERFITDSYFVPNDTVMDTDKNRMMIITGPNMAGKSTYMRQIAVITVMAQIGSYVPAREAKIGVADKIFTRVGASDDLASGQSTFMLEMNEVANILKNATRRSLIVYDEVGRGTSTYDGMAIARAVIEYTLSAKIGARTLFATHYHELIAMENEFSGIVNYNVAAKKRGDSITFLRKIVRGGTDDSYGIEVAKLAGVPNEVVRRAREILSEIESGAKPLTVSKPKEQAEEPDLFSAVMASKDSEAADKLRAADLNTMTPIEAMNFLFELKKTVSD